jgi:hypothetical protein
MEIKLKYSVHSKIVDVLALCTGIKEMKKVSAQKTRRRDKDKDVFGRERCIGC